MSKNLAKLEHLLGYKFQKLALLERAVTHRSWAHEHLPDGDEEKIRELQNESFEFVGDSVLGLAIAEQLYTQSQANAAHAAAAGNRNDNVKDGEVIDA